MYFFFAILCRKVLQNTKADTVTPYFMGEEIYNTISHSNKEMFTVDDSKHVEIFSNYPREYEKNIIDFIR